MTPLVTWDWPDTPITIGVVVLVAVLLHALVLLLIRRTTDLALRRSQAHAAAAAEPHAGGIAGRAARILGAASGLSSARAAQRTKTLGSLLRSVSGVLITIITVLTVLSVLGIPLAPLLASAGVGGIALAFGAQSLVKDYLSGIFLIVEDQFGVGDILTVGTITGTVEEVTLRVTRLRDMSGMVWYVRNGEITQVGNLSQGHSTGFADFPVAYDTDTDNALRVLQGVADAIDAEPAFQDVLLEPPSVLGVDSLIGGGMVLRVAAKTAPNKQYAVVRALRDRGQAALSKAGVQGLALPLPGPATTP